MNCRNYQPIYKDIVYRQTDRHGDVFETRSPTLYAEFCSAKMDYIIKSRDCTKCIVCNAVKIPVVSSLPIAV